jgi:YidC/Oxa1 family membrane protein insertase
MKQQDPESQRNMMLAIALSLAVLLAWQFLYALPRQKELQRQQAQAPTVTSPAVPGTAPGTIGVPQPAPGAGAPAVTPAQMALTREAALAASPRVQIQTPNLLGSINLRGGLIDDVRLAKYREQLSPASPNVVLFAPAATPQGYFAEFGWLPAAGTVTPVPTADTLWTAASTGAMTPAQPAILTWDNGQGVTFKRTVMVDDRFMFTVRDEVINRGPHPIGLVPYGRIYRIGTPKTEGWAILHEGPIGFLGEESRLQEIWYGDLTKEAENNAKARRPAEYQKTYKPARGGWIGFTDKYWASSLIPPQSASYEAAFGAIAKQNGRSEIYWSNYQLAPITIATGATATSEGQLFAGAKEVKTIDSYGTALNIMRFDLMVDWGWFHFITKPLFWLIDWLYGIFGNFGLAILAVTVIVKAAFYPLANKSYESMAKMKKMQPEIEVIREQHKDDRQAQQQELMKLYQKHKINPAAGCLPILLQIPVFFALYKVLFVTIDMRHAPFFGWIKDLSAPDPTSIFNLFGLLPFGVPEFLLVGVWPIIMGLTMWLQMQLNPQQPDPIQQQIFNWMPVMFTFMLASFPAGLVIYWAWSNTLSLLQQYHITRKNGAEIHLWKNLGIDKILAKLKPKGESGPT